MPIRAVLTLEVDQWGSMPIREIRINKRSIGEWLARKTRRKVMTGVISPIGWRPSQDRASHERLFPDGPADFPDGRRAVLVCRECGGLDCGAVSVRIEEAADTILWRGWLWQNDYDSDQNDDFGGSMPDFEFERGPYLAALRGAFD
jgi:hypothetical protein